MRALIPFCIILAGGAQEARAAGSPYGGGTVTGPGGATMPVIRVQTVTSDGLKLTVNTDDGAIEIRIGAQTFQSPVQMVLANATTKYPSPLSGRTSTASFLIAFYDQGVKITSSFVRPVNVKLSSPTIHAGDIVMIRSGSTWSRVSSAQVTEGSAALKIFSDPVIAVLGVESQLLPILMKGQSGPTVTELQQCLNRQGSRLAVDGIFGVKTEGAVKALQSTRHLAPSGVVGPRVWSILKKTAPAKYPRLTIGMDTPAVRTLRHLLILRGYQVAPSGTFDRALEVAVKKFQVRHKLTSNGVVKRMFWHRLGVQ